LVLLYALPYYALHCGICDLRSEFMMQPVIIGNRLSLAAQVEALANSTGARSNR